MHHYILHVLNRSAEALAEQKRSNEFDPFARPFVLGFDYIYLRRCDEAINEFRDRAAARPDPTVQYGLWEACRLKGMYREAALHLELAVIAEDKASAGAIRHAFQVAGDQGVNEWVLSEHQKQSRTEYVSPYKFADDYARLGRKEEMLRALEEAYKERAPSLVFLQREPVFDFLHADERYRALVKKIGLQPAY